MIIPSTLLGMLAVVPLALGAVAPSHAQDGAGEPDSEHVAAALEALRGAVNAHDMSILEPHLDAEYTYQGLPSAASRQVMRQVLQGYPHTLSAITVLGIRPDEDGWKVAVRLEGSGEAKERSVRLSAAYRIVQADIADIQLGGHGSPPAEEKPPEPSVPDVLTVAFRVQKGHPVVQAELAGVAGNFLIDTGAQTLVLNAARFTEDQVQTRPLTHGMPSGVGGAIANVRGARNLDLNWGSAHLPGLRAVVTDLTHLEQSLGISIVGLIGHEILKPYELLFDYAAGTATLYRLDEKHHPIQDYALGTPEHVVPFEMAGHIPVLPAIVAGRDMRLGLDSGAADAMLAARLESELKGQYQFVRRDELRGADKNVRLTTIGRFDAVVLAGVTYPNVIFWFNDITTPSRDLELDGLLGYAFLSSQPTSINFPARRLSLWPASDPR